ncbi:hypothetical protein Y032_0104g3592 [Ancylostoma ceylanicum]|uniref:Uncharacterized protein n=1 Tax=Ancylostoma ceylanicum TaxID=53326 RepID=A0A016TGH8_9BILA|nr:hypothetical protein Y032_0104g3592 [Ancylostoma ceylanicum]
MAQLLKHTGTSKGPVGCGPVSCCLSVGHRVSESMIQALSVEECSRQRERHAAPRHWSVSKWPFRVPCR